MRTVDRRRQAVLEKMGVRTAPELALLLGTAGISPQLDDLTEEENSLAAAVQLARRGYDLLLNYSRSQQDAQQTAEAIRQPPAGNLE